MDAGSLASISSEKMKSRSRHHRAPLRAVASTVYIPPLRSSNPASRHGNSDRFIPDRSAIDFGFAHYQLTESRREKERENYTAASSPSKLLYRKLLAETLFDNRTRILAFKSKPAAATDSFLFKSTVSSHVTKSSKRSYISKTPERTVDAPDLVDDYYLNLLDWGSSNVFSIALGNTVYLWNASDGSASELVTIDEDTGPVTSVSWAPGWAAYCRWPQQFAHSVVGLKQ